MGYKGDSGDTQRAFLANSEERKNTQEYARLRRTSVGIQGNDELLYNKGTHH